MKSPPTPRRTYHHGDLRRALLNTALELVARHGPDGFSLREAAREVGVSSAAAYRHFADKPALLSALAAEGHGQLALAMERAVARLPADAPPARAVATLGTVGQAYVEFALRNPSLFRVMFGPAIEGPEFEPGCAPSGRDAYEVLTAALDELVRTGAVPAERRPGGEILAWSSVHGFATLLVDGALPISPRQRADAWTAICRGILLALGCLPALLPPAPALWSGPHPDHAEHRPRRGRPEPAGG